MDVQFRSLGAGIKRNRSRIETLETDNAELRAQLIEIREHLGLTAVSPVVEE